jgi:hypothetical protein
MHNKTIIGISGFARSGKDTFAKLLAERLEMDKIKTTILSFAFSLKADIDTFCLSKINISAFTEETDLKSKIRPILIAYGACQRSISNGTYWLEKIKPEIDMFFNNGGDVVIVPDLRFKEYSFDEYDFIRSYESNLVLTISKTNADGTQNEPAHESESRNFPFFLQNSDLNVNWNSSSDPVYLNSKIDDCIQLINKKIIKDEK